MEIYVLKEKLQVTESPNECTAQQTAAQNRLQLR